MIPSFAFTWNAEDADTDIAALIEREADRIGALLLTHGAILFRNFAVDSSDTFKRAIEAYSGAGLGYVDGNSPRTKLHDNIYTSTDYPAELVICLHNELSYSHRWPSTLFFFCVTPAVSGGSTLIADSRKILAAISPETRRLFEQKGVLYVRNLHGGLGAGRSWQQTFETELRADVDAYCESGGIEYKWLADGGLRLLQRRPALRVHPKTGETVWFNQADQFHPSTNPAEIYEAIIQLYGSDPFSMPQYACFGDGMPFSDSILGEIRRVTSACTCEVSWQRGDMLIIDNMLTAHGRAPFTGKRRILVAMS